MFFRTGFFIHQSGFVLTVSRKFRRTAGAKFLSVFIFKIAEFTDFRHRFPLVKILRYSTIYTISGNFSTRKLKNNSFFILYNKSKR